MTTHRTARAIACAAAPLAAACLALAQPAAAVAAPLVAAAPGGVHQPIVVGSLFADDGVGRVDVFNPDGSTEAVTPASLNLGTGSAQIGFGEAVAVGDLNGDGLADIVVGAPQADDNAGEAWILFNSATGFAAGTHVLLRFAPRAAGDLEGAAVAISPRTSGGNDVWIGAPGLADAGASAAGGLFRVSVSATGTVQDPASAQLVTQSTAGVPGVSEDGDFLGIELATQRDGVVAGMPYEGIGSQDEAGALLRLHVTDDGTVTAESFNQNSTGVPGASEAYDHFGWSVTADGVAVGAPGEDLGTSKNGGLVQTFTLSSTADDRSALVPGIALSQDSAGIPGVVESSDAFGTTLALGSFSCAGVTQLAIGSPGEAVGTLKGAGALAVTTLPGSAGTCPTSGLTQGSTLPGAAESGDETAASLGVVPGDPAAGSARIDQLLIGDPGEGVAGVAGTGRVLAWSPSGTTSSFGLIGGDHTDAQFGETLAAPLSGSAQE